MGFYSLCVFACSLVADKTNFSSGLSKCKQSKSILKVMTLVMPWLRDIFHLKSKLLRFLSYCASFTHLITLKTFLFGNPICVHRNTWKLCKVWKACVALSVMTSSLGSSLIVCWSTKCLILHIGLMMQSFLSLQILFLSLIAPSWLCITFGCNFTDIINVSVRLGHDMICSAPIEFHCVTAAIKMSS